MRGCQCSAFEGYSAWILGLGRDCSRKAAKWRPMHNGQSVASAAFITIKGRRFSHGGTCSLARVCRFQTPNLCTDLPTLTLYLIRDVSGPVRLGTLSWIFSNQA